jgi:hypothetical protein
MPTPARAASPSWAISTLVRSSRKCLYRVDGPHSAGAASRAPGLFLIALGCGLVIAGYWGHTAVVGDEVFVGRRDELGRFAALLGELAAAEVARTGGWRRRRHAGEDAGEASKSRVLIPANCTITW